jgi:hypothetical protein
MTIKHGDYSSALIDIFLEESFSFLYLLLDLIEIKNKMKIPPLSAVCDFSHIL